MKTKTAIKIIVGTFLLAFVMVLSTSLSSRVYALEDTTNTEETETQNNAENEGVVEDTDEVEDTIGKVEAVIDSFKDIDVGAIKSAFYALLGVVGANALTIVIFLANMVMKRKQSAELNNLINAMPKSVQALLKEQLDNVEAENEELKKELLALRKQYALEGVAEVDVITDSITEALASIEPPTLE